MAVESYTLRVGSTVGSTIVFRLDTLTNEVVIKPFFPMCSKPTIIHYTCSDPPAYAVPTLSSFRTYTMGDPVAITYARDIWNTLVRRGATRNP